MDRAPATVAAQFPRPTADAVNADRRLEQQIKAENDAAEHERSIAAEAKWYAAECFAGRLDEWPDFIDADKLRVAMHALDTALRLEPDAALLRSQLILSQLITEAARAHAEQCAKNKAAAEQSLRDRDDEDKYARENYDERDYILSCGCRGGTTPCAAHNAAAEVVKGLS